MKTRHSQHWYGKPAPDEASVNLSAAQDDLLETRAKAFGVASSKDPKANFGHVFQSGRGAELDFLVGKDTHLVTIVSH